MTALDFEGENSWYAQKGANEWNVGTGGPLYFVLILKKSKFGLWICCGIK